MHALAQRVCRYIREKDLLRAGDRVGVAVSGGADSVALLRLLLELREELGVVLSVVHVNHQIRGAEADADQHFVAGLAGEHALLLHAFSADIPAYAASHHLGLEAAARQVRYDYFQRLLADGSLTRIATAHTLDDQAETVLLRLARGAGITGLAGIYPKWSVSNLQARTAAPARPGELSTAPAIIRPLLSVYRAELRSYLRTLGQAWREDASNLDLRFARNRVRHKLLPILESEMNPRIRELLAETAEIARGEENFWAAEVSRILPHMWSAAPETRNASLRLDLLHDHPLALQRRLLRAAAERLGLRLEFQHVEELLLLAGASPGGEKQVVLPGGWRALRSRDLLRFTPPSAAARAQAFEYPLALPGEVVVAETGTVFRAALGSVPPDQIVGAYDPARLPDRVCVRNWRPGDRFWPAHTAAPKKLKELLQDRKIPLAQRRSWPVIVAGSGEQEIIWVRGFLPPQHLLLSSGQAPGLTIQEYALQEGSHRAE